MVNKSNRGHHFQLGEEGTHMPIDTSLNLSLKCEDDNFSTTWTSHLAVAQPGLLRRQALLN